MRRWRIGGPPRARREKRRDDGARRRRTIERVEVNPRRAALQQPESPASTHRRRQVFDRLVVAFARSISTRSFGGIVAPQIATKRRICAKFVIGIRPGRTGTAMPAARWTASSKSKNFSLSKKSCETRKSAPASTFTLRLREIVRRRRCLGMLLRDSTPRRCRNP